MDDGFGRQARCRPSDSLPETRRSGQPALFRAGYVVYCSGKSGDNRGGKKSQGGVGVAVRKSTSRAEVRSPKFINNRLLNVRIESCGRARTVTFVVDMLQHTLNLFVLLDVNARTGRRRGARLGSEKCKDLGAYGRDTLNDNGD